jgi:hypothetical protein
MGGACLSSSGRSHRRARRAPLRPRPAAQPQAVESVYPGALRLAPAEREALELARAAVGAAAGGAATAAASDHWLPELSGGLVM